VGPTVAQVLLQRGLADADAAKAFLDPKLSMLTPPDGMADRALAADRIARALRAKESIAVFGDYDVDGTTSAAIVTGILRALGGTVTPLVAQRFLGGYGFSENALARVRETGASLLITCDCGSSDHERIAAAQAGGIDVVVIDHHLVPKEALPALAFLNPHRPECGFPYKGLASAGLALNVGAAVRKELGVELDLRPWLDLVALGTVADVAPLDGDNRVLVRAGLERLGGPSVRPGIAALREVAQMKGTTVSAGDIAFRLAPRLNAAGRIADPALTLALLLATSLDEARRCANEIEQINLERRALERRMTAEAESIVRAEHGDDAPRAIVVGADGWHRGVVGITAARLVDTFDAPTLVIAWDGEEGHGSGRGPDGFRLHAALSEARAHLTAFGGHDAAVGFSLKRSEFGAVREAFLAAKARCEPEVQAGDVEADVRVDGVVFPLPSDRDLERFEPVGAGNPEPRYVVEGAEVSRYSRVGEGGAHLKLELRVGPSKFSAFGYELGPRAAGLGSRVNVLGHFRPDTWRGAGHVEMRIVEVESAG
jgi:single-stranded-DNA-specific exonuclease